MSSDTDHPRQRTVAELLAENAGSTTGRRRRRREGDDDAGDGVVEERGTPQRPPAAGPSQSGGHRGAPPQQPRPENRPEQRSDPGVDRWSAPPPAPPQAPRRSGYEGATVPEVRPASLQQPPHVPAPPTSPEPRRQAEPEPRRQQEPEPRRQPPRRHGPPPAQQGTGTYASAPPVQRRPEEPQRNPWAPERPTQQMPRFDRRDDDTGPIAGSPRRGADDGGPPTMLGAPPVTDEPRPDLRGDGGPPTQASPFDPDDLDDIDGVDGVDGPVQDVGDDDGPGARTTAIPAGGRRSVADLEPDDLDGPDDDTGGEQATTAMRTPPRRPRDRPAGLRSRDEVDDLDDDLDEVEAAPHSWAAVIGQWIGGAVVGAGLWVGFAFLWLHLPVIALAGAVVVTVALVLGVRAMLRDDNLRTTLFAVLVGLLLTVSPAILVLARQQV